GGSHRRRRRARARCARAGRRHGRRPAGGARVTIDDLPCSERSEALGEDMAGTAPEERAVLVVEQPGPWGRDAVSESGLRPIADALSAHAKAAGVRIQVVRRVTRRYVVERPSAWLAGVEPGERFLERFDLADPRE